MTKLGIHLVYSSVATTSIYERGILFGDKPTLSLFYYCLFTFGMCELYSVCEHLLLSSPRMALMAL